ncbi:hypothetical protein BSKO_09455 [Bryopsis sp. KO-2023]|nr:hypothetical protein BSKO_09455 [Bryopsis sp. KO-2023]
MGMCTRTFPGVVGKTSTWRVAKTAQKEESLAKLEKELKKDTEQFASLQATEEEGCPVEGHPGPAGADRLGKERGALEGRGGPAGAAGQLEGGAGEVRNNKVIA